MLACTHWDIQQPLYERSGQVASPPQFGDTQDRPSTHTHRHTHTQS